MTEDRKVDREETVVDEVPSDPDVVIDDLGRREPSDDRARRVDPEYAPGAPNAVEVGGGGAVVGVIGGAIVGGAIAGPPGAIVGGVIGALGGAAADEVAEYDDTRVIDDGGA